MSSSSFIYSIPYVCFFIYLTCIFALELRLSLSPKQQGLNSVRYFVLSGFVLFVAFRGNVSSDWISYYPFFENLPKLNGNISAIFSYSEEMMYEKGFAIYASFIKTLLPNYYFFVSFSTIIDLIVLDRFFVKNSKYYTLSFILFFAISGVLMELNLFRNMKAFVLFLLSIKYVYERRFIPYLVLNLIGFTFHSSSIVYILLYPMWDRKILINNMMLIFIICNIIFLFQVKIVESVLLIRGDWMGGVQKYFLYFVEPESYSISLGYIERVITYLFVYRNLNLLLLEKKNTIYINAYILYFVFFSCFTEISVVAERMTCLFVFSYWILYPALIKILLQRRLIYVKIVYIVLLLFCLLKICLTYSGFISKYENVFFSSSSFEQRKAWYQKMGR